VADPDTTWVGLEYFCDEGDELWTMPDDAFARMAAGELEHIGIIRAADVLDATVLHVRKAYPAYFGTYAEAGVIRRWVDGVDGLFVMGRNGMHRYNNMDHSMLSAMAAVDALAGRAPREAVWRVNAEEDYHEDARGD
jgi:protoporphyrinogen oxidase